MTDFIYGVMLSNGTYNGQVLLDIGWISYYLLWGTSALHPSMRTLEEPVPEKETSLSWQRLGVLTVASLIAPGLQVLLGGKDAGVDVLVMIAASIGLFLLVVARMAVLVVQQERSVERERALREAGTALVGAAGRADIGAAALSATRTLAGAGYSARLCLLTGEQLELIGLALSGGTLLSRGTTQRLLLAASIPTATKLPEEVYNELLFSERPRKAHVLSLEVRDEARGVLLAAGPGNLSGSQRAALQSLATSVSLALEGAALTEDLHRRESEARFSSLVARSSDLITVVAADGTVLYQSPSIERVLGYAADEVTGTRFDELMDDHERGRLLAVLSSKNKQPDSGPEAIDCRLRHRDGRWLQFEVLHTNLLDDEHVRGIVLNSRDVSERKAFEEQLAHQAFHDSLTMLANRALFADRVEHALARAGSQGTGIAVVFGRPGRLQDHQRQPRPRRRRRGAGRGRPPAGRDACDPRTRPPASAATSSPCCWRGSSPTTTPPRWPSACWTRSAGRSSWPTPRCSCARASASRSPATAPSPRRPSCCGTPTWPCTSPSATARAATACSRSRCTPRRSSAWSCAPTCSAPSTPTSSRSSTSRWCGWTT